MTFWWRRNQSLSEEIEDYLERETADNLARGMTPDDARAAARRKLGNATRVKEDTRAAWGAWLWLERLAQDLRHAWRMFARNPGFTAVAVLSLAAGVGATCATFSVADTLILRPLAVKDPGGVVVVGSIAEISRGLQQVVASYPEFLDLRERTQSFDGLVAATFLSVGSAARPDDLQKLTYVAPVSGNYFDVLGVRPMLGRAFRADEDIVPGRDAVAVMDYGIWQQQFGSDPGVLGRSVWIGGREYTVIGVAPEGFAGTQNLLEPSYYVPMMMWRSLMRNTPLDPLTTRGYRHLTVKGYLKDGVSQDEAQAEMTALGAALAKTYPENRHRTMVVRTELQSRIAEDSADAMLAGMLLALAVAVLLAACANVAGLLTSRAPVRAREIALRMAIGAGRWRLVRQLLTENLLMALAAGLLGALLGYAGINLFREIELPPDLPAQLIFVMDGRVLAVALGAAVASVLLFGLIPAIRNTRADLTAVMKASGGTGGRRRAWGRSLLVAGQVGVALVLTTMATFMYRGFQQELSGDLGFRRDHLLTMRFDPSMVNYDQARTQRFYQTLLDRVRETPGVRSAALASSLPFMTDADSIDIYPEGYRSPEGETRVDLLGNRVDESYFDTMDVSIMEGRGFRKTDDREAPLVAVVNEVVAAHYWPGQSAIGKRMRVGLETSPWVEVVGIAETGKYVFLAEPPTEMIYLPWRQQPGDSMTLVAESAGSSAALTAPLREVVKRIDSTQPVFNVLTIEKIFAMRATRVAQVLTRTVGSMGVMGLGLALVGLYGLVAYSVSRRTKEIGIRMAVGADRNLVLRMVLRQGLVLALGGIAFGVGLSVLAERALGAVFAVGGGTQVVTGAAMAVAVLCVTMFAVWIPARRAARVEPSVALREE